MEDHLRYLEDLVVGHKAIGIFVLSSKAWIGFAQDSVPVARDHLTGIEVSQANWRNCSSLGRRRTCHGC